MVNYQTDLLNDITFYYLLRRISVRVNSACTSVFYCFHLIRIRICLMAVHENVIKEDV